MKKQVAYLQKLFYDLWNDFGSVYLIVHYSDRTSIGKRGFTDEEKKNGLILVFNNRTNSKLEWDDDGNLSCVLAFGSRKENVYIHHDDLGGVFSPEARVQLLRGDSGKVNDDGSPKDEEKTVQKTGAEDGSQVVSLSNFRKHRPKGRS